MGELGLGRTPVVTGCWQLVSQGGARSDLNSDIVVDSGAQGGPRVSDRES